MNIFNKALVTVLPIFPKSFISLFSRRYIAGETLAEAIEVTEQLNRQNMRTTIDVLGENITRLEEAQAMKQICLQVLDAIDEHKLNANLSIKLTQLGLKLDKQVCLENVRELVERARDYRNFVRIDMEDSTCTDDTIDIYLQLHATYDNVGTVIQAYLKRSVDDVRMLIAKGANLRICKGIYDESPKIAYKNRNVIRNNFMQLVKLMLDADCYVGIATHDPKLIARSYQYIHEKQIDKSRYEFQMLLGVSEDLRKQIINDGHKLRVYVPFGEQWYPYSMRRLKENPRIAGYILKNLFQKG
ncbi:proline dehydrogenase family protein [bacterium]|nr:proline dehydrogenase family protein [bacterium]HDI51294.1 proline dehydrogenase [Bacteroidota bacterium]